MKTKQEQIEDMCEAIASMICQIYNPQCDEYVPHTCSHCYANDTLIGDFAEMLYNAGYRKTFTSDLANDTQKAYKEEYEKAQSELKTEIERLKAENEELTKVVSSKVYDLIDNAKEIANARETWEQQAKIEAVKDFAEKLKEKARELTLEGNKGAGFYIGNILLTNDIDELLKEYEK